MILSIKRIGFFDVGVSSDSQPNPVQYRKQGKEVDGDRIKVVEVDDEGGKVRWALEPNPAAADGVVEKQLDPMRLPFELRNWR